MGDNLLGLAARTTGDRVTRTGLQDAYVNACVQGAAHGAAGDAIVSGAIASTVGAFIRSPLGVVDCIAISA